MVLDAKGAMGHLEGGSFRSVHRSYVCFSRVMIPYLTSTSTEPPVICVESASHRQRNVAALLHSSASRRNRHRCQLQVVTRSTARAVPVRVGNGVGRARRHTLGSSHSNQSKQSKSENDLHV